jgi:hypothetical protein
LFNAWQPVATGKDGASPLGAGFAFDKAGNDSGQYVFCKVVRRKNSDRGNSLVTMGMGRKNGIELAE